MAQQCKRVRIIAQSHLVVTWQDMETKTNHLTSMRTCMPQVMSMIMHP